MLMINIYSADRSVKRNGSTHNIVARVATAWNDDNGHCTDFYY